MATAHLSLNEAPITKALNREAKAMGSEFLGRVLLTALRTSARNRGYLPLKPC
jgi:hypothetical protein